MIDELVRKVAVHDDCSVLPACGHPIVRPGLTLPSDVERFYAICGGILLFRSSLFPIEVVPPSAFESANLAVTGAWSHGDRSDDWYVIARSGNDQLVSIDLNPKRLGHCYDSFWDRHAVAGSSVILANSFEDFLLHCIRYGGRGLYWLAPGYVSLGDAYD